MLREILKHSLGFGSPYVAVVLTVRSLSDRAVLKSLLNEEPSRMLALMSVPCRALLHVSGGIEKCKSYPLHWVSHKGNNNTATVMLPALCHRLVVVAYA